MKKTIEPDTIRPPAYTFMDEGVRFTHWDKVPREKQPLAYHCHMPTAGGMYLYMEGEKYPRKGLPFPEASRANDAVKRSALNLLRFFSSKPMRYFVPLFFFIPFRKKIVASFLDQYANWINQVMGEFYRKPKFCCTMVREVYRVLNELNLSDTEKVLATAVCMFLEYDDAYRYRLQDMFENIDIVSFLLNPQKETRRVVSISFLREDDQTLREKFWPKIGMFLDMLFSVKRVRQILIGFMEQVEKEKMILDTADRYHVLKWYGYNFEGVPFEKRITKRMKIDKAYGRKRNKIPKD